MEKENSSTNVFKMWLSGEVSLRTLILHSVGSLFIGTPDELSMPADFYFIEGDRDIPHPNDYSWHKQRDLLYVDNFRRKLTEKLAKWCVVIALVFFTGGLVIQGVASGVKYAAHQVEKGYKYIFKQDKATPKASEMSKEDAAQRLRDLKKEYFEKSKETADQDTAKKLADIDAEAKEIVQKYPDLRSILTGQ